MEPERFPGGKMKSERELHAGSESIAIAISGLRLVLLLSLTATVVCLLGAAYFGESRATVTLPTGSLCIHRPGP